MEETEITLEDRVMLLEEDLNAINSTLKAIVEHLNINTDDSEPDTSFSVEISRGIILTNKDFSEDFLLSPGMHCLLHSNPSNKMFLHFLNTKEEFICYVRNLEKKAFGNIESIQ